MEVVLGVRPEALSDAPRARFETKDTALSMKIRLIQPLGDTMHVHLATGRHPQVVAAFTAFYGLAVGDDMTVYFDPNRLHFFEKGEAGKSLVYNSSFVEALFHGHGARA
jgi:ABC-type sugar transport system ATPase subunit